MACTTFNLLGLPAELRQSVFEFALIRNSRREVPPLLTALEINRPLHREALHLFYRVNSFGLCELAKENLPTAPDGTVLPIPNPSDVEKVSINFCTGMSMNAYDFRISLHEHLPGAADALFRTVQHAREVHVCLYMHVDRWVTETPTVPAPIALLATLPHLERIKFEWWNASALAARSLVGAWHREFSRATGIKPRPLRIGSMDAGLWEWHAPRGRAHQLRA